MNEPTNWWNSAVFMENADEILEMRLPANFPLQWIVLKTIKSKLNFLMEQDLFLQLLKKHGALTSYLIDF